MSHLQDKLLPDHHSTLGRLSKEPRLAGKVAVVSGASRGFGQAIAIRFVEEGAKVVLCSRSGCDKTIRIISLLKVVVIEASCPVTPLHDLMLK